MLDTPLHPLFVHFPIAFYLLGAGLSLLYLWRQNPQLDQAAIWLFFLSWVGAIIAGISGLVDKGQLAVDDPRQAALDQHISTAIGFMVIAGLVLYARFRWSDILTSKQRWLYLGGMLLGVAMLVITAHQGGELVYQLGVGVTG